MTGPGPFADYGGATAGGLRYPGPDSTDAGIPTYLQNLAEDITARLGAAGTGLVFDTFAGNLTVPQTTSYCSAPIPRIKEVRGAVASTWFAAGSILLTVRGTWDPAVTTHPEDYWGTVQVLGQYSKWSGVGTMNPAVLPSGTVFGCYIYAWGTPL